ncbi:MAG: metallophosphoesterase [Desulfobacterales bacterium]
MKGVNIFFIAFFGLYGLLHLYGFAKLKRALEPGPWTLSGLTLFMIMMVLAPLLVRLLERNAWPTLARILAHIGYVWMGLLFLFVSCALVLDFYRVLMLIIQGAARVDMSRLMPSPHLNFFAPLILALSVAIFGFFQALNIRTERIAIQTAKIPRDIGRVRIVQISDVHLGLIVRQNRLAKILECVNAAHPDLLVSTGDLVDGQLNELAGLADRIRQVRTPLGKYAVTGNHEFYAGIGTALNFTQKAGFTVLRGKALRVSGVLNLVGVDDPAGNRFGTGRKVSEKSLLTDLPRSAFTVLLKHRPLPDDESVGLFDLQLSGHTHKGQIFPFTVLIDLMYPKSAGLLELGAGARLYVSRGSGTWGPPIRFLSTPEVTVIDLISAEIQGASSVSDK